MDYQARALTITKRAPTGNLSTDYNWNYENVTLTTTDGLNLSAWYIPGTQPNAIIVVHGLYANKQCLLPIANKLVQSGYHVLVIDLRGHGESEGNQITYGYREGLDVQAAITYLMNLPDVERIGALGYSMGGAAIVRAATNDENLKALVIMNSYSSLADAIDDGFNQFSDLPRWFFVPLVAQWFEWNLGLKIEQVDSARDLATLSPRPVLIMHSRDDDLFPLHHAYKMYKAAQLPKSLYLTEGFKHNDPKLLESEEYQNRIIRFFDEAFTD